MSKRITLQLFTLSLAASAAFLAGTAQAATTTSTYNLGPQDAGTTILTGTGGLLPWITKGTLPAGSILRSFSVNARLDSQAPGSDSWADDLTAYVDPAPEAPGTAALLQVGGYSKIGNPATWLAWGTGQTGPPSPLVAAKDVSALNIDLSTAQLSLGNGYSVATWSGTITVEYDVSALGVTLTSPAATQGYPTGTSITATATVLDPGAFTDTVTFHTTPIVPSGPTVHTVSADTSSPFSAVLGALPDGTYEIYATVVNNDNPPGTATSATRTFTVAAVIPTTTTVISSINPSTYGQNVTFTATVSPTPTGGTVQFYDGVDPLGSPATVNAGTGVATYSSTTLGVGTHVISANYSGHWLHVASATSSALSQVVDKAQLTVKALNTLRAPNTANPDPLHYLITGYKNGESLATSGVTGTPGLTTDAILSSPVGNYDITCALGSLAAANYSFAFVNGTLTVAEGADTFSVNFYVGPDWPYGGLTTDEQKANVLVPPGVPAGVGDWYASGWLNFLVPWNPGAPLAPVTLTSTLGSEATFVLQTCRNGWTYNGPRTTLLGDGNGNMMDGHVNSTFDSSEWFDMEVSEIPFAVYDVIFYMGITLAQFGDGTGNIVFNGGDVRAFTLKPGAFDGTFTEMVDATTKGNYIVFKGVTGTTFTTRTWGNGFNHVGPFGFQIREATPGTLAITSITGPDLSGTFTINATSDHSVKVVLLKSTDVTTPLASWGEESPTVYGPAKSFSIPVIPNSLEPQAFYKLKVVP